MYTSPIGYGTEVESNYQMVPALHYLIFNIIHESGVHRIIPLYGLWNRTDHWIALATGVGKSGIHWRVPHIP